MGSMLQKGSRTSPDTDRAAGSTSPAPVQSPSPQSIAPALPSARTPRRRSPIAGIPRRVHLLGAGGAGVSGAARLLVDHGHVVSAHDRSETEHIALLREMGIAVEIGAQESAH